MSEIVKKRKSLMIGFSSPQKVERLHQKDRWTFKNVGAKTH
jgi:hypothetical protein